ncbi:MAG: type II secretion system protein GspM [Pseudomonadota bacterium]
MKRVPLALRRAAALALLLLATLGPLALAGEVFATLRADWQTEISRDQTMAQRLSQLATELETIDAARLALEADVARAGLFLAAASKERAQADLQTAITRRITDAGGQVTRVSVIPPEAQLPIQRLSLGVAFSARMEEALRILATVEDTRPLLQLDDLTIIAAERPGNAGAAPILKVKATISGFFLQEHAG